MFTLEDLNEYLNQLPVVDCGVKFTGILARISCRIKERESVVLGDCGDGDLPLFEDRGEWKVVILGDCGAEGGA